MLSKKTDQQPSRKMSKGYNVGSSHVHKKELQVYGPILSDLRS